MARFAKALSVALLIISVGMHWVLLQSVAWVGMVVTYAQRDSLPVALSKTFDGRHPCRLCKAVASGQQSEQEHAPLLKLKKYGLEGFCSDTAVAVTLPPQTARSVFSITTGTDFLRSPPPPPPPRLA
ncbi:MAG TPA: hypothetical protein VMF06_07350 [Candidatus Limnocylindria bacterium]|nr:hypothetical protein [Candidatus Limnocylindria bacterium]